MTLLILIILVLFDKVQKDMLENYSRECTYQDNHTNNRIANFTAELTARLLPPDQFEAELTAFREQAIIERENNKANHQCELLTKHLEKNREKKCSQAYVAYSKQVRDKFATVRIQKLQKEVFRQYASKGQAEAKRMAQAKAQVAHKLNVEIEAKLMRIAESLESSSLTFPQKQERMIASEIKLRKSALIKDAEALYKKHLPVAWTDEGVYCGKAPLERAKAMSAVDALEQALDSCDWFEQVVPLLNIQAKGAAGALGLTADEGLREVAELSQRLRDQASVPRPTGTTVTVDSEFENTCALEQVINVESHDASSDQINDILVFDYAAISPLRSNLIPQLQVNALETAQEKLDHQNGHAKGFTFDPTLSEFLPMVKNEQDFDLVLCTLDASDAPMSMVEGSGISEDVDLGVDEEDEIDLSLLSGIDILANEDVKVQMEEIEV